MMYETETLEITHQDSAGIQRLSADSLRPVSAVYVCWLLVATLLAVAVYKMDWGSPIDHVRPSVLFYFLVLTLHVLQRLKQGGPANALAPDLLLLYVYTLFHEAYVALWALGLAPFSGFVFYFESTIPEGLFIINLGLIGFIFGFELFGVRNRSEVISSSRTIPSHAWGAFGVGMMVFALVMHFGTMAVIGLELFMRYGYTAVQRIDEFVAFPWSLFWSKSIPAMLFGVIVYVLYSALRYKQVFHSKAVLGIVAGFFVVLFLEGNRGPFLTLFLPIVLVRHYFIKPIKIRWLICIAVVALTLFTVMKLTRRLALAPSKMYSELKYRQKEEEVHWTFPLIEMGGSYRIANITAYLVPGEEPYWYGRSWSDAAFHIVPFLQGFVSKFGWLRLAPATWVTWATVGPGKAGAGFSLPAEGYLNFGFPGAFLEMMFFGILIRRIFIWFSRKPSAFTAIVMLGFLAPTLTTIRGHVSLLTSIYTQVLVMAFVLNLLFASEPAQDFEPDVGIGEDELAYSL